jgi:UDP-glucose 4-epimerase
MAHYLVTGGCGFIGSHLVDRLLADGHTVRILDDLSSGYKENILEYFCELEIGDVANSAIVSNCMEGIDGVFHLAAVASVQESNEHWLRTHRTNLTGSVNVFNAARKNKVPVVYASSAAVYGDNADMPLNEKSELRPLTAYGADKLGSELHARVASLVHGVPTTGLRFFNVYGPRQAPTSPYSGVISVFLRCLSNGAPLTIFGDGEQVRDFVYVADIVDALVAAMSNIDTVPKVYNVCTGKSVSINALAKMMKSISGKNVEIEYRNTMKGDIRVSVGSPRCYKQALQINENTELQEGLKKLIFDTDFISKSTVAC